MDFVDLIQANVPLADKNWFGTGGNADYFCQPANHLEFQEVVAFARKRELPIFVLGAGANILISDAGFRGLVIRPQLKNISFVEEITPGTPGAASVLVTAGAGVMIDDLIIACLDQHAGGLEEFSGIPGTVGGAVYMNIHYFQFFLSQFIAHAQVIDVATGEHKKTHYLVEATFRFKKYTPEEAAYARGRSIEIIRHRKQRYPYKGTCGSFFRNFAESEVTIESNGRKMIFVAYYLDKLGIKGELARGGACVSYQHANMLVNLGNATSNDIIQLARAMQELVKKNYGIMPQPECQFVGFDKYPLL